MKRRILLAFVVAALSLATAASRTTQLTSTPAPAEATIPFELVNRHVIIQVKVNNSRPLSFVLDTGDKFAIIDLERAKELGLSLQGELRVAGAGSERPTGSFVRDSTFTIRGLAGFSQPVNIALPVRNLASRMGQDFDGILGSEFIKEFVMELDYQARVLKLHDKNKFSYSGPGESIPIKLNGAGHPIIDGEVTPIGSDPVKGKFVLDIGSGAALILYSPFVNDHHLLSSNIKTIRAIGGAGAGGETSGRVGRVTDLKIGTFKISNPTTMFSEDKEGALASSAVLGNIGARVLSKFRLLFDYSHDRIIFEPNATFSEGFDRASGGLAIVAEGKDYRTFRITDLLDNAPAAEAGLQKNDIITAIDGKSAAALTLSKVNEMFERPASYKLTVRRGDQTLQVTLTPRKLV
jgi:Aspartyl protease/PDZ domain